MNLTVNQECDKKNIIPIFYASDVNYLPFLSVSIASLKDNRNKKKLYKIHILNIDINEPAQKPILCLSEDGFDIEFVDITEKVEEIKNYLQLRDYYTGATYYRVVIANMFKEYDKAIYLDSDTIILGDISKMFNYNLGENYVGAVTDKVVNSNQVFINYSNEVLGISAKRYFNAGILLMNLKKFRNDNFYKQFMNLLMEYKFCVAQDQDYLNVICQDKVKYLPYSWNTMPIGGESNIKPNIIHYNLTLKPWHYMNIPYAKYFWQYAEESSYVDVIRRKFGEYTVDKKQQDALTEKKLILLAQSEIDREDNFIKNRRNVCNIEEEINIFSTEFEETENLFCGSN